MKKPELIKELKNEVDSFSIDEPTIIEDPDKEKIEKIEKDLLDRYGIIIEDYLSLDELTNYYDEVVEQHAKMLLQKPEQVDIEERQYIIGDDRRNKLIRTIIEYMPGMLGRSRFQPHEIAKMFDIYNAFYSRNDHPDCSLCVGRVIQALTDKYNEYK